MPDGPGAVSEALEGDLGGDLGDNNALGDALGDDLGDVFGEVFGGVPGDPTRSGDLGDWVFAAGAVAGSVVLPVILVIMSGFRLGAQNIV